MTNGGTPGMIIFTQKVLFLCLLMMLMEVSCMRHSYEIKVSGPVVLDDHWIELHPELPLKPDKDLQMVLVELEPPFKDDEYQEGSGTNKGKGILMPDQTVINPE